MADSWIRPVVVISRCLELEPVRYDGAVIPHEFVRSLAPWVHYVPVCPEVEIGLGVPRDPVRIVRVNGEARLLQPETNRDLTAELSRFAHDFLRDLTDVDGFLLKNRSPSCGIGDVKIYQGATDPAPSARGAGLFGGLILEHHDGLAIEDEGRLRDYRIREHFLTKLFGLARLRVDVRHGAMRDLVRFHSENKFLLLAYDQEGMRALGRLVANADRLAYDILFDRYREGFQAALAEPPRASPVVNVLEHLSGRFSGRLSREEKAFFRGALDGYREGRLPLSGVTSILRAWAVRFQERYLLAQSFFGPYPEELMSVSDSGKGRT